MAKKHYDWSDGPAEIAQHSVTKHQVFVEYLLKYFQQRTIGAIGRERFKVSLIDGFCGGGLYTIGGTTAEVLGSPLRILDAVKEASFLINQSRDKPIDLDVQYIFVDKDQRAISHLEMVLRDRGYGDLIGNKIYLIHNEFDAASDVIMQLVKLHMPRSQNALFFLDQYGYSDVNAPLVKKILHTLSSSEVVLTFHVSAFATYSNEELTAKIEKTLHIDITRYLDGRSIDDIKGSEADWRRFIQGALYQALVANCGARFFTPFFIRGTGSGHGEYWLIHLSQHHRAQDVMKQVHWQLQNHFVHYGGAGLDMLAPHTMGFMQEFEGGFRFDDIARSESIDALRGQIASKIYEINKPISIGDFFASTCNQSPADAAMYKEVFSHLIGSQDIVIRNTEMRKIHQARYMKDSDMIERPTQNALFPTVKSTS